MVFFFGGRGGGGGGGLFAQVWYVYSEVKMSSFFGNGIGRGGEGEEEEGG